MKRRFMLVWKLYRKKKYGADIDEESDYEDDVQDYDKEDAALIAKIKMMIKKEPIDYNKLGVVKQDSQANHISDLESIKEDDEESDGFGSAQKGIRSK